MGIGSILLRPFRPAVPLLAYLAAGGAWIGAVVALPPGDLRGVAAIVLCLGFGVAFVWMLLSRLRRTFDAKGWGFWMELIVAAGELLLLLLVFGAVHARLGIHANIGEQPGVTHDYWTCLYYSVVTFTTLGYGDFYPLGWGRAIAALQAMMGYIVLAVIASTAAVLLKPGEPGPEESAAERDRA